MKFPSLKTAKVLTPKEIQAIKGGLEDELNKCKDGCKKACKPGGKSIVINPE